MNTKHIKKMNKKIIITVVAASVFVLALVGLFFSGVVSKGAFVGKAGQQYEGGRYDKENPYTEEAMQLNEWESWAPFFGEDKDLAEFEETFSDDKNDDGTPDGWAGYDRTSPY